MQDSQSLEQAKSFFLSGLEKLNSNNFAGAEKDFESSLKFAPNRLSIIVNLSIVLIKANKLKKAEKIIHEGLVYHAKNKDLLLSLVEIYKRIISLNKNYAEVYVNLGNVYRELNMYEESLAAYNNAIILKPNLAEIYANRGNVLQDLKKYQEALEEYDKAIAIKPDYAEAYSNKGNALKELLIYEEAIENHTKAIEINPNYAEAYINRGLILGELNLFEQAIINYEKAITLNSDYSEAYYNRGNALRMLKRFDVALESYDRCIEINSGYAKAYLSRGIVLTELRLLDEALASNDRAIEINPDYADAYLNKSLLLLLLGDLKTGWDLYAWRWKVENLELIKQDLPQPIWVRLNEGLNLYKEWKCIIKTEFSKKLETNIPARDSRTASKKIKILFWAEQGIGDEIFYFGMLNNFAKINAQVTVSADVRLHALFKRSMPEVEFIDKKEITKVCDEIAFDYQAPIGDIGHLCSVAKLLEHQSPKPFLSINNFRSSDFENKNHFLSEKFVCGISWKSNNNDIGIAKSLNLIDLFPLLSIENVVFVSLQYGSTADEIEFVEKNIGIKIHKIGDLDIFNDIDGLVSLISLCDLVVTTSNITAHLTGAIGKKGMVLIPFSKGKIWYWHSGVGPSLWYPSLELVSQSQMNDWTDPINKCKAWVLEQL